MAFQMYEKSHHDALCTRDLPIRNGTLQLHVRSMTAMALLGAYAARSRAYIRRMGEQTRRAGDMTTAANLAPTTSKAMHYLRDGTHIILSADSRRCSVIQRIHILRPGTKHPRRRKIVFQSATKNPS